MSISRTCRSCGSPLPEHLSDGTCPSCGSPQAGHETPKASGTPADREGDFSVKDDSQATRSLHPDPGTTVPAEPAFSNRKFNRTIPNLKGYREVNWVNSGGMGDVFSGIQLGTERRVAIKVMRSSSSHYSQNRERFEKEIRALARIEHNGVVRVYECGECPQGPYFSMEFVDGETLSNRIKQEPQLPPREAVQIIQQAAEAVHEAHRMDILHRDLKPSNIMLATNGTVKVTDFGLAKHIDDTEEFTQTGVVIGTPTYMSPEQANGLHESIGPASDIYGLAGTLYHLLTGSAPHATTSRRQAVKDASNEDVIPARTRRPDLCPILNAILEKGLAREPKDRYASAEQFAEELGHWLADEPTIAVPPTRMQRVSRWVHRYRAALAASVLIPLLAGAAAMVVRRAADEKGIIERALARGEKVTLIGETGLPRWHRWIGLKGMLDYSQLGDRTTGMQSQRYSGLMLVEDPMTDHYRIKADIQHFGGMRADAQNPTTNDASKIGLFWGYRKLTNGEQTAEIMFTLDFNDLSRNTPANPNADDQPRPLRTHGRVFIDLPDIGWKSREVGFGNAPPKYFISKDDQQRIWRTLEIEVHPEGCVISFATKAEKPTRVVYHLTPELLNNTIRSQERVLNELSPLGWTIPDWQPRLSLGVIGLLSTISIRNVVIEPLPAPTP